MLPPEILLHIFEQLQDHEYWPSTRLEPGASVWFSISLVCKTWRALVEPLLYRKIRINCYDQTPITGDRGGILLGNLQKILDRRGFTEDLQLFYSGSSGEDCVADVVNILKGMTSLKNLSFIKAGPNYRPSIMSRAIISQIATMPIQGFNMGNFYAAPMLNHLSSTKNGDLTFGSLKFLRLCHTEIFEFGTLPTHLHHTSRLEVIHFGPRCKLATMCDILRWPKAIKELKIECSGTFTASELQQILDQQTPSLERISLGRFHGPTDRIPKLAHFPSLNRLTLGFLHDLPTSLGTAAQKLSGDSFSCLEVRWWPLCDEQLDTQEPEDKKCAEVFRELTTQYHNINPGGSLKRIDILVRKRCVLGGGTLDICEAFPYLRDVRAEMAKIGISVGLEYLP